MKIFKSLGLSFPLKWWSSYVQCGGVIGRILSARAPEPVHPMDFRATIRPTADVFPTESSSENEASMSGVSFSDRRANTPLSGPASGGPILPGDRGGRAQATEIWPNPKNPVTEIGLDVGIVLGSASAVAF